MPVVVIAVPDRSTVGHLLMSVADAVAAALGLGAGDVVATHVPSGAGAISGAAAPTAESPWPHVWLHGSDRGREPMAAAAAAAEAAVRRWCAEQSVPCEGVWTQWLTR